MNDWHPIRVAARRTGLTPHVIRAWEKRYGAVSPKRTETQRRLYSQEDLDRLSLLRRGTLAGRSIGQIAKLPTEELRRLVEEDEAAQRAYGDAPEPPRRGNVSRQKALEGLLGAVRELDTQRFQRELDAAAISLNRSELISKVVVPVMHAIGDGWRDGSLRIAHEHMASAIVRTFVANLNGAFHTPSPAPEIVVATPAGQNHEIGALLAAATAATDGWRATYLGPSLPAEEIAGAAQQRSAKAVAISVALPTEDPGLHHELEKLARYLAPTTKLLVGGRGATHFRQMLESHEASLLPDFEALRQELEALRAG